MQVRRPDVHAVEQAVAEFDRIGRDAFMAKYGFADRNITYEVEVGGQNYPSKAIFGAAFAFMPDGTARDSGTCDGKEAREHLERLGFRIVDRRAGQSVTQADRIREFVIAYIVDPARQRGEAKVEIVSGDVHTRMGLENALPAVCAVLEGRIFAEKAKVTLLDRHSPIGSDKPSSTIRYQFGIDDVHSFTLDRSALERLKSSFFERHPDFVSFDDSPSFAAMERDYKQAVVTEAQRLLAVMTEESDEALGAALIELLAGRAGLPCNLIDWRAQKVIDDVREAQPGLAEHATGRLARAHDGHAAVIAFLEAVWPAMADGRSSRPCAESRMFPTMLRALVAPGEVLPIRSSPTDHALRFLTGGGGFASAPLSRAELDRVNAMAREIMRVMDEDWGWHPRDMWDVQGFIWVTCRERLDHPSNANEIEKIEKEAVMQPTNLILYGPPGTGKTYRTAQEAVRLCGEAVPEDRDALMQRYEELSKEGRIRFVTFHQSFSYEEFVEGLRPETAPNDEQEGPVGGFRLDPVPGIFRELCAVAEEARKRPKANQTGFDFTGRKFWKMSLGRVGQQDSVYDRAIEDGHISLGYGRDIDWSDARFATLDAIRTEWESAPREDDRPSNYRQLHPFRNELKIGDIVIVPASNRTFRAVGEVVGDYYYEPEGEPTYYHRRRVRWLAVLDEPLPLDTIIEGDFMMRSFYSIPARRVNHDALARLIQPVAAPDEGSANSGETQQFVLIIDEINRANVSKVFGELITLIEPDKRLGMRNALKVRLPYSKREFGVPANLHIIGTMNTADRSIALLDTALRRRFRFEEMAPDTSIPAFIAAENSTGLPLGNVLNTMNRRIEYLVDRDHRIGHAFFIDCKSKADVDAAMRDKVIPLLQEYFFDDWNRLAAVLGEKDKGGNFLVCDTIEDPMGEGGETLKSWRVRDEKDGFEKEAYYRLIWGKSAPVGDAAEDVEGDA
jgi:hypothetical protein